jgi:hypothetical protein
MLGDQVDYCHVYPTFPFGHSHESIPSTFLWRIKRGSTFLTDPISLHFNLYKRIGNREWFETRTAYREEMLDLLGSSVPNDFAIFHAPWPHGPFVSNPDGTFVASYSVDSVDYRRELLCLDALIGDIVDALRKAGKFDEAMLIITSDHGWRLDPDPEIQKIPSFKRRVPLIVKLPGETTGQIIDKEFCPNRLDPLFKAVFAGEKDSETLTKLLNELVRGASE